MEVDVQPVLETDESCAAQGPRALCCAGATVPVFNENTETPVLGQQQWEAVHERRARGQSRSARSPSMRRTASVTISLIGVLQRPSWSASRSSRQCG